MTNEEEARALKRAELKAMQTYPLDEKIALTKAKIKAFCNTNDAYISFSGGKDSTVLLDIARQVAPNIRAVFADTGLEYPEIRQFAKSFENVDIVYPGTYNRKTKKYDRVSFIDIVTKWGYPLISKEVSEVIHGARLGQQSRLDRLHGIGVGPKKEKRKYLPLMEAPFAMSDYCCGAMKKMPMKRYEKERHAYPITGEMADESILRQQNWYKYGCNGFDRKRPKSTPMAFWTEQDVLLYIKTRNIPICSVYGDVVYADTPEQVRMEEIAGHSIDKDSEILCTTGCKRTGCIFCAFGAHLEKGESRFQRLARTHPKQYEYCIGGGEWNGELWQPNKKGLGMGFVFDWVNDIYGKDFIRY